jgi:uroporphyrinogen decarboxylase
MPIMSRRERVEAALRGDELDRPPFCFWHHFRPAGSARALAEATVAFFSGYDLDIYKIMPDLPYPFPRQGIQSPNDWYLLAPLFTAAGNFGRMIDTIRRVRSAVGPDVPVVTTVFSPLAEALRFAGAERLRQHMQDDPVAVHGALGVIADNLTRLGVAILEADSDGLYFALQGAGDGILSAQQYAEFGRPYDLLVLNACREGWLNILHVHGERDVLIDEVLAYPVAAISWSDRLTGIPLERVWAAAPGKAVMGGLDERGAITHGPAEDIVAEMRDAIRQTHGRRLILSPGCSVPDDCPDEWLRAARKAVDALA